MNQARGKLIMNKKIKQSTSSSSRSKWENTKIHIINNKWLYIMTLPGLLYFLIFKYAPMYGVIIAFKDYVPFLGIHATKKGTLI
jgi:putative aldouronate transport system permease protein